jgi:signal transduction histidine kinase
MNNLSLFSILSSTEVIIIPLVFALLLAVIFVLTIKLHAAKKKPNSPPPATIHPAPEQHQEMVIKPPGTDLFQNLIAQSLPLPLIVLDNTQTIIFANQLAADYIGKHSEDLIGKNVYMVLDMSFPSNNTFDSWLKSVIDAPAASSSWERVRLNVRDDHPQRLFDLAAHHGADQTMMVMFDHTKQYAQDDQAIGFIALSVHELRTPLTLLRGYIEVLEEELDNVVSPELQSFMQKMRAMSEQLTAFVNNILNVARIDNDQLELNLQSEDWNHVLKSAIEMINLRAKVRGITLECNFAESLPPVGIDRLSIREVLNNLIDNAIKYSGDSKTIKIESYLNDEGLVETSIQDFGMGISAGTIPNLFTKFYRDHRNRAQIGGTGLGLYLSKALVAAHGGKLWVESEEGKGSTFRFTVLPFDKVSTDQKTGDQDISRTAHGWIKNHSLSNR